MASKGTKLLPGMADDVIEEIRDKALAYVDVRDQRMALTKREVEAKTDLLDVMHSHKKKRYHDSEAELLVEIVRKDEENVKVHHGPDTKAQDVVDAIEKGTPGEDDAIATKTMKRSKKKGGDEE